MSSKAYLRSFLILIAISASLVLFSAHRKAVVAPREECPAGTQKCDEDKTQGEMMIWESVSRHLLANS